MQFSVRLGTSEDRITKKIYFYFLHKLIALH